MPVQVVNRFALFRDEDVNSSEPNQSPQYDNTFANQAAENDTDTPWQEIKRGGTVQKASKKFVPFNENLKPPQPIRYRQKQTRDISGSTASNVYEKPYEKPSDKPYDYHENYCGACNLNFGSKSSILAHIKQNPQVHENFCNLCKRVFKDRNGLQNHVDNSFGHEIFCNLCLSAFKDSWGLQNHFENNYSVGHQFICLTCLLGFKSKTELERHLHTGELHVWCNTCDRKFRNQDERDNHWLHTASKSRTIQCLIFSSFCHFRTVDSSFCHSRTVDDAAITFDKAVHYQAFKLTASRTQALPPTRLRIRRAHRRRTRKTSGARSLPVRRLQENLSQPE
jgi:hypothetical protein